MSPKHLSASILLLLVIAFPTSQYTYYVKPTPDTPCQEDPCYTLSEYVSGSGQLFTSNTTIVFLPGGHVLQRNVTVTNVGRVAFIGNSSSSPTNASRIICTDSTLTFTNVSTLQVADLDFHSCIIELEATSVIFNKSSFKNSSSSYGGAIYAYSSTITFDGETRFESNRAAVSGGGLFAEESKLTFRGNNTFINNEAMERGGGIYMTQSIIKFAGNASFIANNVHQDGGGGIYGYNSSLEFEYWNTIIFLDNSARNGGGLEVNYSTVSFSGVSQFISNSAEYGGGVCVRESTVSFGNDCRCLNNSAELKGGGVYVGRSIVNFGKASQFISNSAEYFGGGVCVRESTVSFGDNSEFIDNSAEVEGGGVEVVYSNVSFGDNSGFIDNSAEFDGGGVFVGNSTVSFGDNSGFIDNSAGRWGGGMQVTWHSMNVSFGDNSRFLNNSAFGGGGVIVGLDSNVRFGDNCAFINNSAEYFGGGVCVRESTVSFGDNSEFIDNSAEVEGGGVEVVYSNVSFGDNSGFIDNSAEFDGGGVFVGNSTVSFGDNSGFIDNSAGRWGGGMQVTWHSMNVSFGDNSRFLNNSAFGGGGVIVGLDSNVRFGDNCAFINNSAEWGGGGVFVLLEGNVTFGDNSGFINNSAWRGGGVYVQESTMCFGDNSRFLNNSAEYDGGGVSVMRSTVSFGDSYFTGNSADIFGGCMVAAKASTVINVGGSSHFMNNVARYGGCIFVDTCNLTFSKAATFSGNSAIISNSYNGGFSDAWYGGAILISSGSITFGGSQVLTNNSAGYGGAIYLTLDSKIYLLPYTTVYFESNIAQYRGGALFVEDNPFTYCIIDSDVRTGAFDTDVFKEYCFIQSHKYGTGCNLVKRPEDYDAVPYMYSIQLRFEDNAAKEAGSVLYGGNLDSCGVCTTKYDYVIGKVAFNFWANISSNLISSDPYRVCICVDNHPDCNQTNTTREIFPGMTIGVPLVAFGQSNGPAPAVIQTYISEGITLASLQSTQQSNNTCTDLRYTVRSTRDINIWSKATLTLYADEPCSTLGLPLEVSVTFLPCPLGFSLSPEGSCECDQRLYKYEVDCDINVQSFHRKDSVWIGFDEQSDNRSQALIFHPYCPFDYCKPETKSVTFTMNNTDKQCNYNRSGHLCGACQHGFSLAVGSSRCMQCSNKFLALLTAFIFAGLVLVVFLFICKVTVAAGTITGLIFYANIIRVNQSTFFPSGETNILTVFIAWLNLDLGIETCFYDGMDAYSMMWLQFVFPIYIWLLVGLITILCNVSTSAAKILGSTNPVAVLATLFLLSYTKLLRTIIAALSFTVLEYPDDETKVVWLYDGNIGYLDRKDGRHIALFLASLMVLLFFFLPYTIFLLLGQCILPRLDLNKLRWLSRANYLRMKSFLDANHAPYKDRNRYWIGLLLVLRFIMFLISAIVDMESPQDPHVNLLVIIASTFLLSMWVWNTSGGVYRKRHINLLESSFIFNLGILAAATYQIKLAGGNQAAIFYSSVSVAFSTFIGIVIYHVHQRLRDSRAWRNLVHKRNNRRARESGWLMEDAPGEVKMEEMLPQVAPTVTYFEIPADERRAMRPITPPLSPGNLTNACEPLNTSQREDAAADEKLEEIIPHVRPTETVAKAMFPVAPPPVPTNFTDLREPLDLLMQ